MVQDLRALPCLGISLLALAGCAEDIELRPGRGLPKPGRYALAIAFPRRPEARGEAQVRLAYIAPPP